MPPSEEFSSDEEEEDAASESGSADRMVRAVSQMSKVLKEIYKEEKRPHRVWVGQRFLNYGKPKAGALQSLQALPKNNPALICQELEKRLQELEKRLQPGLQRLSARGWVEYRPRISAYPSSIRPPAHSFQSHVPPETRRFGAHGSSILVGSSWCWRS